MQFKNIVATVAALAIGSTFAAPAPEAGSVVPRGVNTQNIPAAADSQEEINAPEGYHWYPDGFYCKPKQRRYPNPGYYCDDGYNVNGIPFGWDDYFGDKYKGCCWQQIRYDTCDDGDDGWGSSWDY